MTHRSQIDPELAQLESDLTRAEHRYADSLARTTAAIGTSAAQVTNLELNRWEQDAQKIWQAQSNVIRIHGLETRTGWRHTARHGWLGTSVGTITPIAVFGTSLLDHSFLFPICWIIAVSLDLAGRGLCLHYAGIPDRDTHASPEVAAALARESVRRARFTGQWDPALIETDALDDMDASLAASDHALKRGQQFGRLVGLLAIGCAAAALFASSTQAFPSVVEPWSVLFTSWLFVFGAASWLTAYSYTDCIDQPPYPVAGSASRFKRSVAYEARLVRLSHQPISSRSTLMEYATPALMKRRPLIQAVRHMNQCRKQLEDARWQLDIFESERNTSNTSRKYRAIS